MGKSLFIKSQLIWGLLLTPFVYGKGYVVNIAGDASISSGGSGSGTSGDLRYVLNKINVDIRAGAATVADITFDIGDTTISLEGPLPPLSMFGTVPSVSIDGSNTGAGAITIDGGSNHHRGLTFINCDATLQNITVQNCLAQGGNGGGGGPGAGGALLILGGTTTIAGTVTLNNNEAFGGSGFPDDGFGGGGLGGNGGTDLGGGGGFSGNGGSSNNGFSAGGGGGGLASGGDVTGAGLYEGGGGGGGALYGVATGGTVTSLTGGDGGGFATGDFSIFGGGGGGGTTGGSGGGAAGVAGSGGSGSSGTGGSPTITPPAGGGGGGGGADGGEKFANGGSTTAIFSGGGGGDIGGSSTTGGGGGGISQGGTSFFYGGGGGGTKGGSSTSSTQLGGGGGNGVGTNGIGGNGGFGGGGGNGQNGYGTSGIGGELASNTTAGGGAGLGGCIFVDYGANLVIAGTLSFTGTNTVRGGGNGAAAGPELFINGTSVTFSPPSGTSIVISSVIADGSENSLSGGGGKYQPGTTTHAGGIIVNGPGQIKLSGTNTFAGISTLSGGTLEVGNNSALGLDSAVLNISGGTLSLDNGITAAKALVLSGSAVVSIGGSQTATLTGTISGTGSISQTGGGILYLTNASNTFSGGCTVNEGTLFMPTSSVIGSGTLTLESATICPGTATFSNPVILAGPGIIDIPRSNDSTLSGELTGTGSFTFVGGGTLYLTNASNKFTGGVTIDGKGLLAAVSIGSGPISLMDNTTLELDGNTTYVNAIQSTGDITQVNLTAGNSNTPTLSGTISGMGPFNFTFPGGATLSGTNSFNGGSNIYAAGSGLRIANSGALGTGTVTIMDGSTLQVLDGINLANELSLGGAVTFLGGISTGTGTLSGIIAGNSGSVIVGSSTLALSGSNSFENGLILEGGTLIVANSSALGSGSCNLSSGTLQINNGMTLSNIFVTGAAAVVVPNSSAVILVGTITGTGNFIKSGAGTLTLENAANDYTGTTTISGGVLAISSPGTLPSTTAVAIASGATLNIAQGVTATVTSITGTGGLVINGALTVGEGTLTATLSNFLTGSGTLTKLGTGTLAVTGTTNNFSGEVIVNDGVLITLASACLGTGTLSVNSNGTVGLEGEITPTNGAISLSGTLLNIFGINSYSATMTLGGNATVGALSGVLTLGPIVDGGNAYTLTTVGPGTVILEGTNTYTGTTTATSGTLTINGSCAGPVSVSPGAFCNGNGSIGGTTTVNSNGILRGNGTYQTIVNNGVVSPGNSIGTIYVIGDYTQTGTLEIEVSPTQSDQLVVGNTVTIDPGSIFHLIEYPGSYGKTTTYTIISSAGGVTGTFSTLQIDTPIYATAVLDYSNPLLVQLILTAQNQLTTSLQGNPQAVLNALNAISASGSSAVSGIFSSLFPLSSEELSSALNQMNPVLYKGMTIIQENNISKVESILSTRFQTILDTRSCCSPEQSVEVKRPRKKWFKKRQKETPPCFRKKAFETWMAGIGDFLNQKATYSAYSNQFGYSGDTYGVITGIDYSIYDYLYVGVLGAYTHSNVNWTGEQGEGHINSGYAGLYFSTIQGMYYGNLSFMGAWSRFEGERKIHYPGVDVSAQMHHPGKQFMLHGDTGFNIDVGQGFLVRPFDSLEYTTQKEQGFVESGAGEYNLSTRSSIAQVLRNLLGVNFAKCFKQSHSKWMIDLGLGWIYEARFKGKSYIASFAGTDIPFTTIGYFPSRHLFSPTLDVTGWLLHDTLSLSFYYQGEFGNKYWDQTVGLEAGYRF